MEDKQERIFEAIFNAEEISWKQMIHSIIRDEGMDPWDINISLLAKRFLEMLKKMQRMDLKISGKVLLAAAILLKLKSIKFLKSDMLELDKMFLSVTESEDDDMLVDEGEEEEKRKKQIGQEIEQMPLIPRTPQPRTRKISVYDLVDALERALTTKNRRVLRELSIPKVDKPKKLYDINQLINSILDKITIHFRSGNEKFTFTQLVPSNEKMDKIFTFIPLLHLANLRRVDLNQEKNFSEIEIKLLDSTPVDINLEEEKKE